MLLVIKHDEFIRPSATGGFQMLRTSEVKKVSCESCEGFPQIKMFVLEVYRLRTPSTRIGMTSFSLRTSSTEEMKP